ncbi:hypothetical protein ACQEV2_13315 [Streptomyces sp. CA-251387]|uniref:hypothetical protein n=1 Tax=Streptomyces sp. CA-251387 TaxID=3240064 RepID=UPI003D8ABE16
MEIEVPELTEVATVLQPDDRVTRGGERPDPVRGAVSLGLPVVQPITEDLAGDDAALRTLLGDREWSFHLVHLGATFTPSEDARFGQAWLTVQLRRDDGAEAEPPIVWSLTPQRAAQPVERPLSFTLGARLLFEASIEVSTTGRRTEVFVEGYGLQEPTCTWEFTPTSTDEVRGSQRLALVARTPRETAVTGAVDLRATLTRRRLGFFPFRTTLDTGAPLSFTIGTRLSSA